jgi:hypothetical protein
MEIRKMNDMRDVVTGLVIGLVAAGCFMVLLFLSIDTADEYYDCKQMELTVKELHKYTDKEIKCWMIIRRVEKAEAYNVMSEEDTSSFLE